MRVLIADTYYPGVLAEHYQRRPELARAGYAEQHSELMKLRFGVSDALSRAFEQLGHPATELVVNSPQLQRAWAAEAGLSAPLALISRGRRAQRLALLSIALDQVKRWRPDVLYVQDLWFFPRAALMRMHATARIVAGQIASPAPPRRMLRGYDLIVTSFPHFVDRFRGAGLDAEYLPLAFDARVLDALRERGADPSPAAAARSVPVAFVGGVHTQVHQRGTRLLERVAQAVDLQVWGYGRETLPPFSPLLASHRGEVWGLEMYEALARARIVVNRHIAAAEGYANNMRLYEATGVGALVVTEGAPNLGRLFRLGEEVVTYDEGGDLVATLRHLIQADDERLAIASAGQQRTLRDHTYERRTPELAALLGARL